MVEANVKILQDLTWFLHTVCDHAVNRAFFTRNPSDFSRTRELPMARVIAMIVDLFKRSLSVEVREFFETLVKGEPPGKSAFCQQRQKLKALFFQLWNQVLVEGFYHYYAAQAGLWRGWRLLALDGSTLYLPATGELAAHFGTQVNQHGGVPMGRVVEVHDVLNHLTLWAGLYPVRCGEGSIVLENLGRLPAHSVLLLDRCYPSFALIYALGHQPSPLHFVMRCRVDFNQEVKAFMASAATDKVVEFHPTSKAKATLKHLGYPLCAAPTVKVRLVKVPLLGGDTEVLLCDLWDQDRTSAEDLRELYGLRWGIETAFDTQKNQLQVEQFSGVSLWAIEQDFHAGVFVHNLQALIEKQSGGYTHQRSEKRKYPCRINTNCCWAALKHNVVRLLWADDPLPMLLYLERAFTQYLEPVRPGRKYKRKRKVKRLNGKYHTLTNYKRAI